MSDDPADNVPAAASAAALLAFACSGCGGAMVYQAVPTGTAPALGTEGIPDAAVEYAKARAAWNPLLRCLHCARTEALATTDQRVPGRSFATDDQSSSEARARELPATSCPSCGAAAAVKGLQGGRSCSSCGMTLIRADLPGTGWSRIDGVLPMLIDAETAKARMLAESRFPRVGPFNRKRYEALELRPVFFPYLVFSAPTVARFKGTAARDHGMRIRRDSRGQTQQTPDLRDERKVDGRWAGTLTIAVPADRAAIAATPRSLIDERSAPVVTEGVRVGLPFDPAHNVAQAVPFTPKYVAGVPFQLPDATFEQHRGHWEKQKGPRLKQAIELEQLEGSTLFEAQQAIVVEEQHEEYRVVLIPAWIGTIPDRDLRVWVDGSTGVAFVEPPRLSFFDPRQGGLKRLATLSFIVVILVLLVLVNI